MENPTNANEKDVRMACLTLARLVRAEYPDRLSLAKIAFTWGDASTHEVDALARLEAEGGLLQ